MPKPEQVARDGSIPWESCKATLYGKVQTVRYKTFCGQWYRACGIQLLRIIVVATPKGSVPFRVFFCNDPMLNVTTILETYARRWAIEVTFRDLKQLLGFADSPARLQAAVLRVAPFVGLLYSVLVLWFAEGAWKSTFAALPVRPWYRCKATLCFADVLRTAQRMLSSVDISDPARLFDDLQKFPASSPEGLDPPIQVAA